MNKSKILIIGLSLAVVVTTVLIVVYISRHPFRQTNVTTDKTQIIEVTKEKIFYPHLISLQNAIEYLGDQGVRFKKYDLASQEISDLFKMDVFGIQKVEYNLQGDRALVLVRQDDSFVYQVVDFAAQKTYRLNQTDIFSAAWLNDEQIIFSYSENEQGKIGQVKYDGSGVQVLAIIDVFSAIIVPSPDQKSLIVYPEAEGYGANYLYLYNMSAKSLDKLAGNGYQSGAQWSPDGQKILTNTFDKNGQIKALEVMEISSQKRRLVSSTSNLSKAIWLDNDKIILTETQKNENDQFALIDLGQTLKTNFKTDFTNLSSNLTINAQDLMLAPDNKTLYFTSNDWLYKLELQ